jgi:hypothetical protein
MSAYIDGMPPPPKKSQPWLWIGLGCVGLLFVVIAFVAFLLTAVFGSMRMSTPYKESVARAQHDARVIEALGTPVSPAYIFGGEINTHNSDGDANFGIPLHGPKGGATMVVKATKTNGTWTYQIMTVTVQGRVINLLEPAPSTSP